MKRDPAPATSVSGQGADAVRDRNIELLERVRLDPRVDRRIKRIARRLLRTHYRAKKDQAKLMRLIAEFDAEGIHIDGGDGS